MSLERVPPLSAGHIRTGREGGVPAPPASCTPPPSTPARPGLAVPRGGGTSLTRAAPACRVFYKVKSRSAHMKSHAEQEKKAAALRQKEKEAAAAAATVAAASPHQPALREESGAGERG